MTILLCLFFWCGSTAPIVSKMPAVGNYGAATGPSCFDRMKMGFFIGACVGMASGAIFGGFSAFRLITAMCWIYMLFSTFSIRFVEVMRRRLCIFIEIYMNFDYQDKLTNCEQYKRDILFVQRRNKSFFMPILTLATLATPRGIFFKLNISCAIFLSKYK